MATQKEREMVARLLSAESTPAEKVRFGNIVLWFDRSQGSLCTPESGHRFEDGRLNYSRCFSSDTWGHVQPDGRIMRYGQQVGTVDQLVAVTESGGDGDGNSDAN